MSHQRTAQATHPGPVFSQFEDADLDYTVNWVGRIGTDTIASDTWVNEYSSGLTFSGETNTTTESTARITGDTGRYLITNTITLTTSGETMQQQITLIIKRNAGTEPRDYS